MPTERRLPQRHTGSMGMTVGGVRGQRRQEIPNTVNIISLFWSIREAFVMATRSIQELIGLSVAPTTR